MTAHKVLELAAELRGYYTPLVSDVMDSLGLPSGVLPITIQSLTAPEPDLKVCGPAFPCRVVPTDDYVEIDTILAMVDEIPDGAVPVVAADRDIGAALWGGLMSGRALERGAVAAVVNGGVRDINQIVDLGFPVFGAYRTITDIRRRGQMVSFNVSVSIGGVSIAPGDLMFGDANGVLRVTQADAESVLAQLANAGPEEQSVADGLQSGRSAREMFDENRRF